MHRSKKIYCRLAAIYVSRFDGPMLTAFVFFFAVSLFQVDAQMFYSTHVLEVSQVDVWLPRDVERRVVPRKEH